MLRSRKTIGPRPTSLVEPFAARTVPTPRPARMLVPWTALVLGLLAFAPGSPQAGTIRGTLRVPSGEMVAYPAMNPYPGRAGALPAPHAGRHGLATDAVVYVERVPAAAESALGRERHETPKLAQKDQSFVPRVIAVAVGTAVDFPNLDPIYHNVFSLSPARRFDLGKYPRGRSRQVVFSKPGLINVYCDIHSDMEAFVLVLPHHGFARPSVTGEFRLPDLPAGSYSLKSWHPDLGERSTTVEVPAVGAVTADLSYF